MRSSLIGRFRHEGVGGLASCLSGRGLPGRPIGVKRVCPFSAVRGARLFLPGAHAGPAPDGAFLTCCSSWHLRIVRGRHLGRRSKPSLGGLKGCRLRLPLCRVCVKGCIAGSPGGGIRQPGDRKAADPRSIPLLLRQEDDLLAF